MLKLPCKADDSMLTLLRDVLKCELIRIPSENIYPLRIIEKKGNIIKEIGELKNILSKPNEFKLSRNDYERFSMASLSGRKTRKANFELGIRILEGFLKGFGLNNSFFNSTLKGEVSVAFSFENVYKISIDNGLLGNALKNHRIDNIRLTDFLNKQSELLLIDSIIESNEFVVSFYKEDNTDLSIDINAIELANINSKISINKIGSNSVSVHRENALPFAFTCIKLLADYTGKINNLTTINKLPPMFSEHNNEYVKHRIFDELTMIKIETS